MLRELEEFYSPKTLEDALEKLRQYEGAARPIAGGTDLVADPPPGVRCLVNITGLGLDYVVDEPEQVRIGATVTMGRLATCPSILGLAGGILSLSTSQGWPRQVREAATLGGNLANAGPFADTPPALLALEARVVVSHLAGERTIPMEDFFLGYRTTAHGQGILKEVQIPRPAPGTVGLFLKMGRSSVDVAMVNVGAVLQMQKGRCRRARIALGAVTRCPTRLTAAERILEEQPLDDDTIRQVTFLVVESVQPILDHRASADFRREMAGVLVGRALKTLSQAA